MPLVSSRGGVRCFLICLGVSIFSPVQAAKDFAPAIYEVELPSATVSPGEQIPIRIVLGNRGDQPSVFPFRAEIKAVSLDSPGNNLVLGTGEPFPMTTLWRKNQAHEMGFSLFVPSSATPGSYDLQLVLRGRDFSCDVSASSRVALGNKDPQDAVSLGTLKIAAEAKAAGEKFVKTFAAVPQTVPSGAAPKGKSITFSREGLSVELGLDRPVIYRAGGSPNEGLQDGTEGSGPLFRVYRKDTKSWHSNSTDIQATYRTEVEEPRVIYHTELRRGQDLVATLDIYFIIAGHEVRLGYENIKEEPNYLLTNLEWPRLLRAVGPGARLATGRFGGRLIDPNKSLPSTNIHNQIWYDPLLSTLVYTPTTLAALTQVSMADSLTSSVERGTTAASAGTGVNFVHWISPLSAKWEQWLRASVSSQVRVRFLLPESPGTALTWMDGAKLLRRDVESIRPPDLYQDTFLYKIMIDVEGFHTPFAKPSATPLTSLDQSREIMKSIGRMTDGQHQIVYLTGAQHEGIDTKSPDMFTINKKVGTYRDLVKLIEEGPELNATMSFYAVINEAFKDSPMWDERMIAREANGDLQVYANFFGRIAYFINYDWFAQHVAPDLINRVLAFYPIRDTYHLDVHTTRTHNVDFNPANPCTPDMGYEGRLSIITQFNQHGFDLTSEGFMGPYVGKIGHAWLLQCQSYTSVVGEEAIPLVPMVYHGHATYGLPSELNPLLGILYGATISLDVVPPEKMEPFWNWKGNSLPDSLYFQNFPFQLLRNREMQHYERKGDVRRVTYDDDTYVEIEVPDAQLKPFGNYQETKNCRFTVMVDGDIVAKDFTAFLPGPKAGTRLVYAKFDGQFSYKAPAGWTDSKKLLVEPLIDNSGSAIKKAARIQDGMIAFDISPACPMRVSYQE